MNIQTFYEHPPTRYAPFDWIAVDSEGDQTVIGRGHTKQDAIANLMGRMGATCDDVAYELAGRGFSNYQIALVMDKDFKGTAALPLRATNQGVNHGICV